jgi:Peptidase M15
MSGLSPSAQKLLEAIQGGQGYGPVRVTSSYRDPERNRRVGGAKNSQHIHGNALDLDVSGWSDAQKQALLDTAIQNGARGIGIYPSGNSLHIDVREKPTVWGMNPAGAYAGMDPSQAPEWARKSLSAMFSPTPAQAAPVQPLPPPAQVASLPVAAVPAHDEGPSESETAEAVPDADNLPPVLSSPAMVPPMQDNGLGMLLAGLARQARPQVSAPQAPQAQTAQIIPGGPVRVLDTTQALLTPAMVRQQMGMG